MLAESYKFKEILAMKKSFRKLIFNMSNSNEKKILLSYFLCFLEYMTY